MIDPPQQPAEQWARPEVTESLEHGAPIEQTLSRRQLRELRAAESSSAVPPAASEPILIEPIPVEPVPVVSTSTGSHWSVGIHDNDDPFENTFSREVRSTSSLSTNALVLPQMPTGGIAGPVAGTGEIIVTGMIAVSGIVASTGTVPT
ncbi:MAG: hypothetical protein Q7J04_06430, partial [Microcella sp.]|nr:hypothetical protein [Microcella sp.]